MLDIEIDFDNEKHKRVLYESMKGLHGPHRVRISESRSGRTNAQNAWYWATTVTGLQNFLNEQGEPYTKEQAHEILKAKFLSEPVPDPNTGEVLTWRVKSTTELTTKEFAEYHDNCRNWLREMFGIDTPNPEEKETTNAS